MSGVQQPWWIIMLPASAIADVLPVRREVTNWCAQDNSLVSRDTQFKSGSPSIALPRDLVSLVSITWHQWQQLTVKLRPVCWLLVHQSAPSINDKSLPSDAIKAVCTYVAVLWGCAKPTNLQIIECFRSTKLGAFDNPLWYVANPTLNTDLGVPFVWDQIMRVCPLYQALFKTLLSSSPGFAPRQLYKQVRHMNTDISSDVTGCRVPSFLTTCHHV
jgi:hypothetical protein